MVNFWNFFILILIVEFKILIVILMNILRYMIMPEGFIHVVLPENLKINKCLNVHLLILRR